MSEIVEVVHRDNPARTVRKAAQGLCDHHPVTCLVDLRFDRHFPEISFRPAFLVPLLSADIVDDPVLGNSDQPPSEGALVWLVLPAIPQRPDEHLLSDIFGAALVKRPTAVGVDKCAIQLVGSSESILVSPGKRLFNVVNRLARGAGHAERIVTDHNSAVSPALRALA